MNTKGQIESYIESVYAYFALFFLMIAFFFLFSMAGIEQGGITQETIKGQNTPLETGPVLHALLQTPVPADLDRRLKAVSKYQEYLTDNPGVWKEQTIAGFIRNIGMHLKDPQSQKELLRDALYEIIKPEEINWEGILIINYQSLPPGGLAQIPLSKKPISDRVKKSRVTGVLIPAQTGELIGVSFQYAQGEDRE